jgi:hypothetical protein
VLITYLHLSGNVFLHLAEKWRRTNSSFLALEGDEIILLRLVWTLTVRVLLFIHIFLCQESEPITDSKFHIESAYVLRRAEMNGRGDEEGQTEWSIRQTGVYHQLQSSTHQPPTTNKQPTSTFMLIAPSKTFETQLAGALERSLLTHFHVSPWNVHRLLVADSLQGWPNYMASLEKQLKEQVGHR